MLNQFDPSLPLHLDVREALRQQLGDRLLPVVIRRAAGVSEALAEGMTIVDYDPESIAVHDYLDLANWVAPGLLQQTWASANFAGVNVLRRPADIASSTANSLEIEAQPANFCTCTASIRDV